METIIIKTPSDLEEYINEEGNVQIEGHLKLECSVEINKCLIVKGSIEAGGYIEAGGHIKAGGYIFSFSFDISFREYLKSSTLPFYREFYAAMPPLKKYAKDILDESKCWDDYKRLITKEEAQKICAWDGWHWIIRVQLEMFFGLKERVTSVDIGNKE